uniref:RNase H type-1 domain-containing protein n=1 Tax=Cannabis sativa TaxID=3483 RepID=A0A803PIZ3_CANSA
MGCRDFIRKESCWIVGNGSLIDLWSAPWIPWLDWDSYCAAFNPRCQVTKVSLLSELLDDSGNFNLDAAARWAFSVKGAYNSFIKGTLNAPKSLWTQIWNAPIHERSKFFIWKVARDLLPCGNRLSSIFQNNMRCIFCDDVEDSVIPLDRELFIQVAVSLCNTLWNARNSCFHEGTVVSPEVILCKTLSDVQEWRVARSKLPPVVVGSTPNSIVPRKASVRVFSDAAVRGSVAYTAFLVLDSKDQILGVATYKFQVNSPLEAEAYGLISAVEFCQSSGWNEVRFYIDCRILVKALEDHNCPSWRLMPLFSKLFFLLCCCSRINVTWVPRNFNLPAHELAKWVASLGICQSLSAEEIILVLGCLNVVV